MHNADSSEESEQTSSRSDNQLQEHHLRIHQLMQPDIPESTQKVGLQPEQVKSKKGQ